MPVFDGQAVDQAVTNPAFLDAQVDDTAFGIIGLSNTAPASGAPIGNTQGLLNHLESTTGCTETSDGTTYSSQTRITNGQNHEVALGELDSAFDGTTGHKHSGSMGDGPPLPGTAITGNPLKGSFVQGVDLSAVTGTSYDVSSYLTGFPVSSGPTVEGIVVTGGFNRVVLQQATGAFTGDPYLDAFGNVVYGRVTNTGGPSGTWTLSFYSLIGGTETVYNFISASDIRWFFQQLFNPLVDAPVYSEIAIIPSDNATADVITATTSLQGKVMLASAAATNVGTSSSAGTANATVANADHVHRGVASFAKTAGTLRYGAISLTPGTGINITDNTDGSYTIDSTGASGVSSIAANGGSPETGAISLNDGPGISITDTGGGNFTIASSSVNNALLNGAFDLWTRYGSTTVNIGDGNTIYAADRWAVKCSLGPSGVISNSRIAGSVDGSKYASQVQISTAPTSSPNNGTEYYQILENFDSMKFYNKSASFSVQLKALGNVTQVGIAFVYNTTEVLGTPTVIGTETLVTVSTGAFAMGSILNQAIGTAQTTSGVIGIRIRITAVSSGNTYDLNNGYIVEQAMLNVGSTVGTFKRQFDSIADEIEGCQRFYEKSYDYGTNQGAVGATPGQIEIYQPLTTGILYWFTFYQVTKRVTPTPTIYSPQTGAAGFIFNGSTLSDVAVSTVGVTGQKGFSQINATINTDQVAQWQYSADAEIY